MVLRCKRIHKPGRTLNFHGFSWSYAGRKSNLHPRAEISSMASLNPKSSIARTVSSYEFLVFCANSLLRLSRSMWFHLAPAGSNLFQLLPADSSSSNLFQFVHHFSMYATRHVRRLSPTFVGLKADFH